MMKETPSSSKSRMETEGETSHEDKEAAASASNSLKMAAAATATDRSSDNHAVRYAFDLTFLRRIWKLQPLLFPRFLSLGVLLLCLLLLLASAEQVLAYYVGLIAGQYYQVLTAADLPGFQSVTARSVALLAAMIATKSLKEFVGRSLTVAWRRTLTAALHRKYFQGVKYYHVNVLERDELDNPDQRMTADVDLFCSTYGSILVDLVLTPFTISYYSYSAYSRAGWPGPTAMFVLFLVSAVANKLLMSPVVNATVEQERREGDFRFKHVSVRISAESLAFHGSASVVESAKTNAKLTALCDSQQRVFNRKLALDLATNTFNYVGSIASYLVIAVPIFSGDYSDLEAPEVAKRISENSFVCMYLAFQFSKLTNLAATVSSMAGATHRVAELRERLSDDKDDREPKGKASGDDGTPPVMVVIKKAPTEDGGDDDQSPLTTTTTTDERVVAGGTPDGALLRLEDVTISAPKRPDRVLVRELSLEVREGESLLVTGRSSAGKSSLLRTLRGLWGPASGDIFRGWTDSDEGAFFLPQRPFFTDGSLLEQVMYPRSAGAAGDDEDFKAWLVSVTEELALSDLLVRCGGDLGNSSQAFDPTVAVTRDPGWSNWLDVLSPGEAQRVAFIRLLARFRDADKPSVVFLDEATSALSVEMEETLYGKLLDTGVAVVSVGHRGALRSFHAAELIVGLEGGRWSLRRDKEE